MDGVELIFNSTLKEEQLDGVDILFFNRIITKTTIQNVLEMREKYGFKLIADFDDHWELGKDHILYDEYQYFRATEFMIEYIRVSDAVFVTHDRLAKEAQQYNKNVHILPNAIPMWGQFLVKKTESEFTRLFWAGGVTHRQDIELLRNPVKRFGEFKNIQMVMGGYSENPEYKAMASAFTNGGKLNNMLIESLPIDDYYYCYSECDIALIPLRETRFNSFKSNLKILEAANIGAKVIVSNVHPYKDFPFVDYVNNQSDWLKLVKSNLSDKGYMEYKGECLKMYCFKHFNFDKINKERKQIFEYVTGKQSKAGEIPERLQRAS
jgi:hypothetical protein